MCQGRIVVLLSLYTLQALASNDVVSLYGKFETCLHLSEVYDNPFNYSEVAVFGDIGGPDGAVTVDGFYYQNYSRTYTDGEKLTPLGTPQWCLRYSPKHVGNFTVTLAVTNASGTTVIATTSFEAVDQAINPKGFIGKSPNGIHFQFQNGSTYFPVGENVCWVDPQNGTYDYDVYFERLSDVGVNYARLWLTDSSWDDLAVQIGMANFSLPNSWRLDYVVELAEVKGIHLLMCTESFNCFCTNTKNPCFWGQDFCYYNKAVGGILDLPEEFFTNPDAMNDYKNKLRYVIARYSYSTAVFAWEFFNEVDLTDNYETTVQANWTNEMAAYVRLLDVNQHLISTSYSNSYGDSVVQGLDALSFTMTHNYGSLDIAADTAQYPYKKLLLYKKPSYVAEFGITNEDDDPLGVSLHNGLWAPLFSLGAGSCMTWWWDTWVDHYQLYPIFKPFASFVSSLDLANFNWQQSNTSSSDASVRTWGMTDITGRRGLGWLQDDCYTWLNQHVGVECSYRTGMMVTFSGCWNTNAYSATWYSPEGGEVIDVSLQRPQ
ncbi:hypothetical protein EMCRGX_G001382 [Ephydatia muelleri]